MIDQSTWAGRKFHSSYQSWAARRVVEANGDHPQDVRVALIRSGCSAPTLIIQITRASLGG